MDQARDAATPAEVTASFTAAPVPLVARRLETLAMVGEVRLLPDGRCEAVAEPLCAPTRRRGIRIHLRA